MAKDDLSHRLLVDGNVLVFRTIALLKVKDIDLLEVEHMVDAELTVLV